MTGRYRSTCDSLYQLVREDYSRNHGFEQFAYVASGNRRSYDSSIPGYPTIPETATAYPQTTKTGETTKYYWDNASVLLETDASGNIRALNTIGNEIISREYRANPGDPNCVREKYYYLYDHLGNTRALTDGQGNLVQEYFYDVYGKCWNVKKDSINGYQYVGGYGVSADADDGLVYMRARYQDPGLGVFISCDPIGLRGGLSPQW